MGLLLLRSQLFRYSQSSTSVRGILTIDDLIKILEIIRRPDKYLSWKVMCPAFSVSLVSVLLCEFSNVHIILNGMYDTVKSVSILIWVLSGAGILYKIFALLTENVARYISDRVSKKQAVAEAIQNEQVEEGRIADLLKTLNRKEIAVAKYVLLQDDLVWLPAENISVLSLLNKGILRVLNRVSTLRGIYYAEAAQCLPCKWMDHVSKYVSKYKTNITNMWEDVPAAGFDIYQEDN